MRTRFLTGLSAAIFAAILTLGLARPGFAAGANMYLSAPSSMVKSGQVLVVGVHINSGSDEINAVQANLSYSSDKLDFVSISPASTFPVESENSGGNGVVHIGRGIIGSVKGDQLIANVTLKAKAVGAAEVNFAAGSSATEAGNNKVVSVSTAGSKYTVTDGTSSGQSGVSHDVTPPKISDVKVADINYRSVKLTWKTSEPSQSEVSYGSTNAYGVTSVDTNYVTDHSMELASEALMPATTYHFKITNKDTAGNAASTSDQKFTTKGAVITVKVIGSSKQNLKGATVTIDNKSQETDKNGLATFSNLSAGSHSVVATKDGKSSSISVTTVIPQAVPASVTLQLDISPISMLTALFMVILLALLGLAIVKQLKKSKKAIPSSDTSKPEKPAERKHHHK